MNDAFLNLDATKRTRILQAAYEEFSEHTYDNASTNRIVKKAKIGKGMLFYYFGSKEELYHYLLDYGFDFIEENYLGELDKFTGDFIERYKLITKEKMKAYAKTPYILDFFGKIYLNDQFVTLPLSVAEKRDHAMQMAYGRLYDNLDYTLFRDDIPSEQAIKMIKWTIDGYEKDLSMRLKEIELSYENVLPFLDEFNNLLNQLKKIFYK